MVLSVDALKTGFAFVLLENGASIWMRRGSRAEI